MTPFLRRALAAWTALVLLFLWFPIAILVAWSFNDSRLNVLWKGFTLRWYAVAFSDAGLLRSLGNSLWVAAWATLLSVPLGTAAAFLLERHRFRGRDLLETTLLLPMIAPEVVIGTSLLALFVAVGLELGFATVIASHVAFCVPFVLVAVRARVASLDPALEEAALDLGATPAAAFRRVVLPVVAPAIASAALLSFMLSFDELVVTWFTASASSRTLPIEIYGRIRRGLDPGLNAISTVLVAATLAVVALAGLVRRRSGGSR
ncbi:ABC transporter permease [bacterium]|nr:ABC transporter permease [bacterium]